MTIKPPRTSPHDAIVKQLLKLIVPDPEREGLADTPFRVLQAWQEWTEGYHVDTDALLKTFEDGAESYDEMVFVGAIPFYSTCEHHMAPFFGLAHVAYMPGNGRIVGLSKIPRLVDAFARRLTVQERITTQIADTMNTVLRPRGVAVLMQARHMCVESRGVAKPGTITTTSAVRGLFKTDAAVRSEFHSLVALQKGMGNG